MCNRPVSGGTSGACREGIRFPVFQVFLNSWFKKRFVNEFSLWVVVLSVFVSRGRQPAVQGCIPDHRLGARPGHDVIPAFYWSFLYREYWAFKSTVAVSDALKSWVVTSGTLLQGANQPVRTRARGERRVDEITKQMVVWSDGVQTFR